MRAILAYSETVRKCFTLLNFAWVCLDVLRRPISSSNSITQLSSLVCFVKDITAQAFVGKNIQRVYLFSISGLHAWNSLIPKISFWGNPNSVLKLMPQKEMNWNWPLLLPVSCFLLFLQLCQKWHLSISGFVTRVDPNSLGMRHRNEGRRAAGKMVGLAKLRVEKPHAKEGMWCDSISVKFYSEQWQRERSVEQRVGDCLGRGRREFSGWQKWITVSLPWWLPECTHLPKLSRTIIIWNLLYGILSQ